MSIEKIRLLKTVKAGSKVWVQGSEISSPIPPVLLQEIKLNKNTVEILKITPDNVVGGESSDKNTSSLPIVKLKTIRPRKSKV
jgi:hypothetical protein